MSLTLKSLVLLYLQQRGEPVPVADVIAYHTHGGNYEASSVRARLAELVQVGLVAKVDSTEPGAPARYMDANAWKHWKEAEGVTDAVVDSVDPILFPLVARKKPKPFWERFKEWYRFWFIGEPAT